MPKITYYRGNKYISFNSYLITVNFISTNESIAV